MSSRECFSVYSDMRSNEWASDWMSEEKILYDSTPVNEEYGQ